MDTEKDPFYEGLRTGNGSNVTLVDCPHRTVPGARVKTAAQKRRGKKIFIGTRAGVRDFGFAGDDIFKVKKGGSETVF